MPSRESQTVKRRIDVSGATALGDAVASTRRYAAEHGLGPRDRARLCIIVEELVSNLLEHGDCPAPQIAIDLSRRDAAITLVIEDNGEAFDPRAAPADEPFPANGGGAGLRLVNRWSEIVSYEPGNGRNRLELILALTGR